MSEVPTTGRRTVLKRSAAALGVAGTGLGAFALASEPAKAEVVINQATFSIPDYSIRTDDGAVSGVWIRASGEYSYDSPDIEPSDWRVNLRASATGDQYDRIGRYTEVSFGFTGNGQFEVLGNLLDHVSFAASDFEVPDGADSVSQTVYCQLVFQLLDGGSTLAEATAEDSGTLTVEEAGIDATLSLDGSGGFEVQATPGDPTPTVG